MQIEYLKKCTYASSSPSFLATIRDFKCAASICPSSIVNSANASSTSVSVNLSPQVMSECLNISASILPWCQRLECQQLEHRKRERWWCQRLECQQLEHRKREHGVEAAVPQEGSSKRWCKKQQQNPRSRPNSLAR